MHAYDPSAPVGTACPTCTSTQIAPGKWGWMCCKECGTRFQVKHESMPTNRHDRRRASALARRRGR